MNVGTASRLVALTKGIYPSSKANENDTIDIWMGIFGNKDDELMETALRSCWTGCKFFPTPADITEAIKDLQYIEQTKPKQLEYHSNRNDSLADKAFKMVASGQAKKFLQEVDVKNLVDYARQYFPDISEKTVRENLPELYHGQESQDACFACRIASTNDCITKGFVVKHWMGKDGRIQNQILQCQKKMDRGAK